MVRHNGVVYDHGHLSLDLAQQEWVSYSLEQKFSHQSYEAESGLSPGWDRARHKTAIYHESH